jgi:hypothetical protein
MYCNRRRHSLCCWVYSLVAVVASQLTRNIYSFEQGAWWARLPLKSSNDSVDSSGDMNGTLAAMMNTNMTFVGLDAMGCGTAKLPGDTGTGGVGIEDLVAFLDAAAAHAPELKVFAVTSSHHQLFQYCHDYLNNNHTAVNWTRVGHVIAERTAGRSNFAGLYIDDFYVMMCRPEATTFKLHGALSATPCVTMEDMDNMRAAMHRVNPSLAFIPLVYHSELAWAVPHSYVLGTTGRFVPPSMASVSVLLKPPHINNMAPTRLRFYYLTRLSAWNNPTLIAQQKAVNGTVVFEALVNGHVVLSVDASARSGIRVFDADVAHLIGDSRTPVNISFTTYPTAAAADRAHSWMQRDCYKTSYAFGVSLGGRTTTSPLDVAYITSGGANIMARQPTEAIISGHSEAMMVCRRASTACNFNIDFDRDMK